MGGGLIQLVAYGAQDVYLTGNPQITFFKSLYRRHTNFSMESVKHNFMGAPAFGAKITSVIPRNGDLLHKIYVRAVLSAGNSGSDNKKWAWIQYLGHALLQSVELSIGGQRIDLHTSQWSQVWYELTYKEVHTRAYNNLIGNLPTNCTLQKEHDEVVLYIPLNFFFCRHIGQALPLVALQYHEVKIDITFEKLENLIVSSGFTHAASELGLRMVDAQLYCDMIYLDTDERKRFANSSHEILVEQVQHLQDTVDLNNQIELPFNHPVKELIWVVRPPRKRYLWYHATDMEAMQSMATKRFVLALAKYTDAGELVLHDNSIVPADNLSEGRLLSMFQRIQAIALSPSPVVENISILGDFLTMAEISESTDVLLQGFETRPSQGDGSEALDVAVNMPFNYGIYLDGSVNPLDTAVLQLNGHDRFSPRDAAYFNHIQPLHHHHSGPCDGVNVYSFAISPEELQPSGTLNFSRIDSAILSFQLGVKSMTRNDLWNKFLQGSSISVFAPNYNILRVMSGMAGLAFSN